MPFQAVHAAAVPSFTCCLSLLVHYFIPNIREYKTIYICRSPQTVPILSLSVEIQKNAGEIPELMEDLSAASSEILGIVNLNEIHSSSAGKLQEANCRGPLGLPCAGSRFLLVNKPGLSRFLPCHRKPFRKAAAHPAFSSGAALTHQAQK